MFASLVCTSGEKIGRIDNLSSIQDVFIREILSEKFEELDRWEISLNERAILKEFMKFPVIQDSYVFHNAVSETDYSTRRAYARMIKYKYKSIIVRPMVMLEELNLSLSNLTDDSMKEKVAMMLEENSDGRISRNQVHFYYRGKEYETWIKFPDSKIAVRLFGFNQIQGTDYEFLKEIQLNEINLREYGSRLYSGLDGYDYYMIEPDEEKAKLKLVKLFDEYENSEVLKELYPESKVTLVAEKEYAPAYLVQVEA